MMVQMWNADRQGGPRAIGKVGADTCSNVCELSPKIEYFTSKFEQNTKNEIILNRRYPNPAASETSSGCVHEVNVWELGRGTSVENQKENRIQNTRKNTRGERNL
jgi:hypothetical protein